MNADNLIEVRPGACSGRPCLTDTPITIYDVLECETGGMSQQELLDNFTALGAEHLQAVQMFAAVRDNDLLDRFMSADPGVVRAPAVDVQAGERHANPA